MSWICAILSKRLTPRSPPPQSFLQMCAWTSIVHFRPMKLFACFFNKFLNIQLASTLTALSSLSRSFSVNLLFTSLCHPIFFSPVSQTVSNLEQMRVSLRLFLELFLLPR